MLRLENMHLKLYIILSMCYNEQVRRKQEMRICLMAEGDNNMMYEMKYDNRFSHAEYLVEATWIMEENRHGELWKFKFPNGRVVSVSRTASWNYSYVSMGLSMAATYGYLRGLYECVTIYGGEFKDEEGYMEFDEVIAYLDKVQAIPITEKSE